MGGRHTHCAMALDRMHSTYLGMCQQIVVDAEAVLPSSGKL